MEQTIRRLARVLGASTIESAGHDTRFVVYGFKGGVLQVSVEAAQQRFMAVLKDGDGIVRCTIDLAPIRRVTEDRDFPHRIKLYVGPMCVQIDSEPTLAIELVTSDEESPAT